jgi:CheY-like chemotaxis protein
MLLPSLAVMTTILHVEDNRDLADLVRVAFETFGFRGRNLIALSVREFEQLLGKAGALRIDLIIADMNLKDGTGLDVVRIVRASPEYVHVPVLILSGDGDPDKVNRAYALGANCYLSKIPAGRSMSEVVKTIYDHWLRDALLPQHPSVSRSRMLLATAVQFRTRLANIYMEIAQRQKKGAEFWMSLALREGNLANLFAFVGRQLKQDLPDDVLDAIAAYQQEQDPIFNRIESALKRNLVSTPEDAYRILLEYFSWFEVGPFAQVSASLFPVAPKAMHAMIDLGVATLEEIAAWLQSHISDHAVRERIAALRAHASHLQSMQVNDRE